MIGLVFVGQVLIEIPVQPPQVPVELPMLPGRMGLLVEFPMYVPEFVVDLSVLFVELVMQAVVIPAVMRLGWRA
jgi:hypothetical protein